MRIDRSTVLEALQTLKATPEQVANALKKEGAIQKPGEDTMKFIVRALRKTLGAPSWTTKNRERKGKPW